MPLDKLRVVEDFFAQGLWLIDVEKGPRIIGMSIKVSPSGMLAVVKAVSSEGPMVTFVGAPTLEGLYRKLQTTLASNAVKWRPDQFALDR